MITAILQYDLLDERTATCVLCLDTDQGDEVWLHLRAPLRLMQSGQITGPGEEMGAATRSPWHSSDRAAYDPDRQRHVKNITRRYERKTRRPLGLLCLIRRHTRWRYPGRHEKG